MPDDPASGSSRRRRSWRGVVFVAVAVALLACATPATAKPKTLRQATYEKMKAFMEKYDAYGFSDVIDVGGRWTYRTALQTVDLKVDPYLSAVGAYDPNTGTIIFSKDPRTAKAALLTGFGETAWHEVSHAIEDQHGDAGLLDSEAYRERNLDYMTHVARDGRMRLALLEDRARRGDSVAKLKETWDMFLSTLDTAAKVNPEYPPDLTRLKDWFGFSVDPQAIKDHYLSQKALPGRQGENLRAALAPVGDPVVLWDTWNIFTTYNGGTSPTVTLEGACRVTEIDTYHWNDGRGAEPGTIALISTAGKEYGPWQATGLAGQGGATDVTWVVHPDVVVPAGTYTVVDSDPDTWSQNGQSEGHGMSSGHGVPAD